MSILRISNFLNVIMSGLSALVEIFSPTVVYKITQQQPDWNGKFVTFIK